MARIMIFATAGAGGDLPPLMSATLALRERGHDTTFVGDAALRRLTDTLGIKADVLPGELDLGPRLAAIIGQAMSAAGGDLNKAGPMVQRGLTVWAHEVAGHVVTAVERHQPALIMTSLFGVEAVDAACPPVPWTVINSTFYVGPNPPRPLELDWGSRAIALVHRYAELLESPDLVLHATDQHFDYGFNRLPSRHHYVGPLGIWEPRQEIPPQLNADGGPWVLVSVSTQRQDDLAIAEAALTALADRPVRVLVTLGSEHQPSEITSRPPNATVLQTASHAAVLERAALLIGHAGHGTVMKSLWHGKPMILIPWGRDQPGVAARAEALGVAAVLQPVQATPSVLGATVDEVLASEEMRERATAQSVRLRATDPPEAAAGLLETLV